MNVSMISKDILDKIAGFPVGNLIEERKEVTLLGVDFNDAKSFSHKDLWSAYRKVRGKDAKTNRSQN